jgi:subtilisin family serine protease|tara:strand:- start:528 stop:1052 length:525 start_codon:yes stop_codon:yes gene_type:complete
MAQINIDLSTGVDLEVIEGDNLLAKLELSNEDGSAFVVGSSDAIIFYVSTLAGEPILLLTSQEVAANVVPNGTLYALVDTAIAGLLDVDTTRVDNVSWNTESVYRKNKISDGIPLKNGVIVDTDSITVELYPSTAFLREGEYKYSLKFVTLPVIDSNFEGSKTWLEGKLIIKKL